MTFLKGISLEDDPDRTEGERAGNRSNSCLFLTRSASRKPRLVGGVEGRIEKEHFLIAYCGSIRSP